MSAVTPLDPARAHYGVYEFCKSCGIGTARLYNLIAEGRVPVITVNGKKRISADTAMSLVDESGRWRGAGEPTSSPNFDGHVVSGRTRNCLHNLGIETVQALREFLEKHGHDYILRTEPNFGKISMREVESLLGGEVIEVKITAFMLDAGVKAVVEHAHGPIIEMVAQIYASMAAARP